MFRATEENFYIIYMSGKNVVPEVYAPEGIFVSWDGYYVVDYETMSKYDKFVETLEKECGVLKLIR
jgi:hypothetical protein